MSEGNGTPTIDPHLQQLLGDLGVRLGPERLLALARLRPDILSKLLDADEQRLVEFVRTIGAAEAGGGWWRDKTPDGEEPTPRREPVPVPLIQIKDSHQGSWLWYGYLARGTVTLLSADAKAGKTTFLSCMLKSMEQGGEFAGRSLAKSRVLVVSEEPEPVWVERREQMDLTVNVDVVIRDTKFPNVAEWDAFVSQVMRWRDLGKHDVVILDTISKMWPVRDENAATEVEMALAVLRRVPTQQTGLLIVHHTGKADKGDFRTARGSSAMGAFPEFLTELRRYKENDLEDRRRVLRGVGRMGTRPPELVLEWDGGSGYREVGTKSQVKESEGPFGVVCALLGCSIMTVAGIIDSWPDDPENQPPPYSTLSRWLCNWANEKKLRQDGDGTKSNPYQYSLP